MDHFIRVNLRDLDPLHFSWWILIHQKMHDIIQNILLKIYQQRLCYVGSFIRDTYAIGKRNFL